MQHLTATQIQDFEALLIGRRRVLAGELRGEISQADTQRTAQAGEGALDQVDRAQIDAMTVQASGMVDHYAVELADVDAALARIVDGSYGECVDCGGEVPYERLAAHPTAKRCVGCQELRERRRKQGAA